MNEMKIAFATNGNNLETEIALHFGRANNFLIYDTEKGDFKIFENPEIQGKELPPDFLNRLRVDVVITFSLGPRAFEKLKNYKIKALKAAEGNILENIKKFKEGKLRNLTQGDIF